MHDAPYRERLEAAALNLLDEAERHMMDEHLAVCRSCETDLVAYQEVVATLAFTAGPVAAPPHLRARLCERVRQLWMEE